MSQIRKALEENKVKLDSLDNEEAKLAGEAAELSSKLEAPEVTMAKINVLGRQAEEALANSKPAHAEELKSEIAKIRESREKTITEIKAINEKVDLIRSERRVFVKGLLYECHPVIKASFGSMLETALRWVEKEVAACEQVANEAGIVLPGSFSNELRIWQQGPLIGGVDWRPLRDHLNQWIP